LVPRLQQVIGPWGKLGVLRDHSQPLLVLKDLIAQRVPPFVEQMHVTDLLDPFGCWMMRRMAASGNVVAEEGLAGVYLVDSVQPLDGIVRHGSGKVPARFAHVGINRRGVAKQVRLPLAGVAAHEPIEILEAHADGPLVKRPGLACRKGRSVVVLAEPRGGIAVLLENLADGSYVLWDDAVVAREARGGFRDYAEAGRVMIATRNERRPRRRAKRRRMKLRVTETCLRDPIQRWSWDNAAECAWCAEANVVGHNEQHVGRAFGRYHTRCPPRLGLRGFLFDHAAEFGVGCRELLSVNGRGGTGRTERAGDLLGVARHDRR